ncbi:MAG: hypothetical protein KA397_05075 [Paludibacteraceae bacterium]|nr:hypothetical protein [Paludibacteraceae bacterium]MBP6284922.1 hypothetical protein [Paludibacteraceae bacterium]
MKNTILIIGIAVIALIFSIWGYNALKDNSVSGKIDVYSAVPRQPIAMLHINQIADLQSSLLYNNNYWLDLTKLEALAPIQTILTKTDSLIETSTDIRDFLNSREALISIFIDSTETQSLLSMSISQNDWNMLEETLLTAIFPKYKKEEIKLKSSTVLLLSNESDSLYMAFENNLFVCSSSPSLLSSTIAHIQTKTSVFADDKAFNTVKEIAGKTIPANLFINTKQLPLLTKAWFHPDAKRIFQFTDLYADWCGFDISFLEERIVIAGFSSSEKSNKQIQLFNQQTTGANTLVQFMPQFTYFFNQSYISQLELYKKNLQSILSSEEKELANTQHNKLLSSTGENPSLFFDRHFDKEIAFGYTPFTLSLEQNGFMIIKLKEENEAKTRLKQMAEGSSPTASISSYQNTDIVKWNTSGFASCVFGPQYAFTEEYIAIYNGNMYIAPTRDLLLYVMQQKDRNRTLNRSVSYTNTTRHIYQNANNTLYANIPMILRHVNTLFTPEKVVWINSTRPLWNNFQTFVLQAENKRKDLQFQQIAVNYTKRTEIDILQEERAELLTDNNSESMIIDSVTEIPKEAPTQATEKETTTQPLKTWELMLKKPIAIAPQVVVNQTTGLHEIVVQDTDNFLSLISSEGKLIQRIPISGRIISDIHQIDMYGNKKLQIVFNTAEKLYIIDRNGKNVRPFPIKFAAKATAGVSIFDYNSNRDYRFFIPLSNKKIALYKKDASQPSDWNFKQSVGTISKPIQYFRTNGMDFIVAANDKKSYFLHRRGNERLVPETAIMASKNNRFSMINSGGIEKFVTTDKKGNILLINPNKQVDKVQLRSWNELHAFDTYTVLKAPYYVFLENKRLEIYDEEFTSVYLNEEIQTKSPTFTLWNNKLLTYNEKTKKAVLIDLLTYKEIANDIKTDKNLFFIGQLKPYKKPCIVVNEKNRLVNYLLE